MRKINRIKNKLEYFENKKMDDQIDLLTYSRFSADCCPSTYTNSLGCLCNSYQETEAITSRGGNGTIPTGTC